MFETLVVHPRNGLTKCLVYPLGDSRLGFICPVEVMRATHTVRHGGSSHEARMHVVCTTERNETISVDPFDFRWNSGTFAFFALSHLDLTKSFLTSYLARSIAGRR